METKNLLNPINNTDLDMKNYFRFLSKKYKISIKTIKYLAQYYSEINYIDGLISAILIFKQTTNKIIVEKNKIKFLILESININKEFIDKNNSEDICTNCCYLFDGKINLN